MSRRYKAILPPLQVDPDPKKSRHLCRLEGCPEPVKARGLCEYDLERVRAAGLLDELALAPKRKNGQTAGGKTAKASEGPVVPNLQPEPPASMTASDDKGTAAAIEEMPSAASPGEHPVTQSARTPTEVMRTLVQGIQDVGAALSAAFGPDDLEAPVPETVAFAVGQSVEPVGDRVAQDVSDTPEVEQLRRRVEQLADQAQGAMGWGEIIVDKVMDMAHQLTTDLVCLMQASGGKERPSSYLRDRAHQLRAQADAAELLLELPAGEDVKGITLFVPAQDGKSSQLVYLDMDRRPQDKAFQAVADSILHQVRGILDLERARLQRVVWGRDA